MSSDPQGLVAATASLSLASKDSTYFLTHIIFQVEDKLFNVPRYHFERNDIFATTFQLCPPEGQEVEGFSEQTPFRLENIRKKDFEAFLSVLYPLKIPLRYSDIAADDWKSVLGLSSMWNFDSICELAIRELSVGDKLDSVSKILLGIKYNVPQWVIAGCSALIYRSHGPRVEEAKLLEEDLTMIVWDLREQKIWSAVGRGYPFDMKAKIVEAFAGYPVTFDV